MCNLRCASGPLAEAMIEVITSDCVFIAGGRREIGNCNDLRIC